MNRAVSVEEYLGGFSGEVLAVLEEVRRIVKENAPGAQEVISYGMPAYKGYGVLVYFAAQKKHLGFYPTASAIEVFKDELKAYHTSKGTVQFPYGRPIPYDLLAKMVRYRVVEDHEKELQKKAKRSGKKA